MGLAQKIQATKPPISYHIGLTKAPLYNSADTLHRPNRYLPSQAEAVVVGPFSPGWVVVRQDGFLYITPIAKLRDYDPEDATPPPISPASQLITYEGVVQVPGASQAVLFERARAWVSQAYNLQNAEITQQDAATGQIVLRGARLVALRNTYDNVPRSSYAGVVRHTLSIYVKDGRYKYVLSNLTHDALKTPHLNSGGPLEQDHANLFGYVGLGSRKPWTDLKVEALRDVRHLLDGLQTAMTLQKPQRRKDPSDF
ncbi:hypothetical protein GCM10023172_35040 [Hymenobacter ginsengisoli]|uniref:DUF4468 domain-containing protein n=1 Tax=Hymenobacter ginsengisoli TaxID=1051626 RepID=A0ABP8QPA9_9BACT|nr:DUF4468 domain-containing protein [Hymenobacter sp. KCTC 23674]MBO2033083.1 DUF4468 domain-containing protein [Hymenobacter sp. BT559]